MRLLILCAAIVLPAGSTAAPPAPATPQATASISKEACRSANLQPADSRPKVEAKRLDQLPPGNLMLAVMREVDGCNEPVVVRYGYGTGFEAPKAPAADPPERPRARLYR